MQVRIARFYTLHSHALLSSCSRSDFSLRKPFAVAQRFTDLSIRDQSSASKSGVVHEGPGQLDHDISHVISFFVYERYNLLGKFIESAEFIELEKKFARLRVLDVSKCFFNIYTHSITWAVKDKAFAKQNRNAYSFEGEFDTLMQKANYNETNGIVIGPEASRIFAEIILQDVDFRLKQVLLQKDLRYGVDYALRRYVDDYYVFANSDDQLDRVTDQLRVQLEAYKLFLNESKSTTFGRPFVSSLTLAREELHALISSFSSALDVDANSSLVQEVRKRQKMLLRSIKQTPTVSKALREIVDSPPTYFGYVAAKFCLLKDSTMHAALEKLNDAVEAKIALEPRAHERDCESYLLICDHLAAPDVTNRTKRKIFDASFGGQLSDVTLDKLPAYVGFVDWTGMHVSHLLSRKELRPVYSWS
jgi:hypothetical protein